MPEAVLTHTRVAAALVVTEVETPRWADGAPTGVSQIYYVRSLIVPAGASFFTAAMPVSM